jgi:hypothetical protein
VFPIFQPGHILHAFFNSHLSTGGGVALLYAAKELDKISTANEDEKIGVQIIKNALKVILYPVDPISPCTQLSVFSLGPDPWIFAGSLDDHSFKCWC